MRQLRWGKSCLRGSNPDPFAKRSVEQPHRDFRCPTEEDSGWGGSLRADVPRPCGHSHRTRADRVLKSGRWPNLIRPAAWLTPGFRTRTTLTRRASIGVAFFPWRSPDGGRDRARYATWAGLGGPRRQPSISSASRAGHRNDIGAHLLANKDSARDDLPRQLRGVPGERPQALDRPERRGIRRGRLEGAVRAVAERLKREAAPQVVTELWTATTTLMGLRHRREQVKSMMEGVGTMFLDVRGMKESWVYQDILAEGEARGKAEGARRAGAQRPPPPGPQEAGRAR